MHTRQVLLVDDNPADVRLVREAISEHPVPYALRVANDGCQALEMIGPDVDLVLLDLNLPRVGGRHVLRTLKEDPRLRAIPVVVLSSSRAEQDVEASYAMHANGYISKPVELASFLEMVHTTLRFWFETAELPDGAVDART